MARYEMARYEISQSASGEILGVYEGETAEEAIRAMLRDARAEDQDPDPGLRVREIDAFVRAWDSEEYGFTGTSEDVDNYFTVENFVRMWGEAPADEEMAALRLQAHAALDNVTLTPSRRGEMKQNTIAIYTHGDGTAIDGWDPDRLDAAAYATPRAKALFGALSVSPDDEEYVLAEARDGSGRWGLFGLTTDGHRFAVEEG